MARTVTILGLTAILGCGAAAPPEGSTPAPLGHCVLEGGAEELPLRVEGLPDNLIVNGVPAQVVLTGEERLRARILRPLRFEGWTTVGALRPYLATAREGPVHMVRGAAVRRIEVREAGLEATVFLSSDPLDPDEDPEHPFSGVSLRTTVDCAALVLGPLSEVPPAAPPLEVTHYLLGNQDLTLLDGPAGAPLGVLTIAGVAEDPIRGLGVLEIRAGYAHIQGAYSYGTIEGWIEAGRLGPIPAEPVLSPMYSSGHGAGCGRSEHPYSYRGPATVRAGTEVRALETDAVWAVVAEDMQAEVGVRSSGEIEVIAVPGLASEQCGNLEFDLAMVPTGSVVLPAVP